VWCVCVCVVCVCVWCVCMCVVCVCVCVSVCVCCVTEIRTGSLAMQEQYRYFEICSTNWSGHTVPPKWHTYGKIKLTFVRSVTKLTLVQLVLQCSIISRLITVPIYTFNWYVYKLPVTKHHEMIYEFDHKWNFQLTKQFRTQTQTHTHTRTYTYTCIWS